MVLKEKKLVVAFIDWVIPKNKIQIEAIHNMGLTAAFFVNTYNHATATYFRENDVYLPLEANFIKRLRQIVRFLKEKRNVIHHIEVYPGGRFSFIYILLSKILRIRSICVERGDLLYYNRTGYGLFTRVSMWFCYKYADMVWYREPYMANLLKKIGVKDFFFLHNAVKTPSIVVKSRTIDFLWVNRLIPERRSDWFIDTLRKEDFQSSTNVLAGILTETLYNEQQEYVTNNTPPNLQVLEYAADPNDLYARARFFVLPADVIFANNALLESMSLGVVPLIARQQGSDVIVDDGRNGFIFDFDKASLEATMLKAMRISDEQYKQMSDAAMQKVRDVFSVDKFSSELRELYTKIEK